MVVIEDSRRRPVADIHQSSSMRHRHHLQHTKDTIKQAQTHNFKQGRVSAKQSRKKHRAPELSEEPENSQPTDMPPRKKRAAQPKPSPVKMGRKMLASNDQSLKGRLTIILSTKTNEFIWDTQKKLFQQWASRVKWDGIALAAPLYRAGITLYLSMPQIAKFGNLKDLVAKYIFSRFHDGKF